MKKIQLFAAPTINELQSDINAWLSEHKDAHIIETNITSLPTSKSLLDEPKSEGQFAFYILYTPADESEEESVISATRQMPSELIDGSNNITEFN
jgi:hypothetical protein